MDSRSSEDHVDHASSSSPTPETNDALQRGLATLALSQSTNPQADASESKQSQQRAGNGTSGPLPGSEEEAAKTYRINTLRRDSDEPDPEDQDEEANVKPDELLSVIFNFDMPREVDLNVKIKGDFNVTILA